MVRTAPGIVMDTTPAYAQKHCDPATTTGAPPAVICGAIGVQGATMTGTQGIGVSTPSAAAVAAATVGFANDWHMPKGGMFAPGTMSVMFATGRPSTAGRGATTFRVDGTMPNEQVIIAPDTTHGLPTSSHPRPGPVRVHSLDALTDEVSSAPVVVTKHTTDLSFSCSQPRADGTR